MKGGTASLWYLGVVGENVVVENAQKEGHADFAAGGEGRGGGQERRGANGDHIRRGRREVRAEECVV